MVADVEFRPSIVAFDAAWLNDSAFLKGIRMIKIAKALKNTGGFHINAFKCHL